MLRSGGRLCRAGALSEAKLVAHPARATSVGRQMALAVVKLKIIPPRTALPDAKKIDQFSSNIRIFHMKFRCLMTGIDFVVIYFMFFPRCFWGKYII